MEALGTEFNSTFNGIMCPDEADFMAQLLGNFSFPDELQSDSNFSISSAFWPSHDESNFNIYSSDGANAADPYYFSQGSVGYYPHHHFSGGYCDNNTMEGDHELLVNEDVSNDSFLMSEDARCGNLELRRQHEKPSDDQLEPLKDEKSKKRPRIPRGLQRSKKSMVKSNSCPKADDEINNTNHTNNSACSEDDSNTSHDQINVAASTSSSKGSLAGKTRASRGSATDPQSLYARKRREKINERLRILQSLVPNGTKVDISTMLEEAVQYVKFLQLQIKLLSSDDLWMYAPIAYNGKDIRA